MQPEKTVPHVLLPYVCSGRRFAPFAMPTESTTTLSGNHVRLHLKSCLARLSAPAQMLKTLAALLLVEEDVLEAMLTRRTVNTRGETFTKKLGVQDADFTRDGIVKSLYEVQYP